MNAGFDTAAARRYLLGLAGDDERESIERDYFASEEALDRVARAEDELVEGYLAGRLDPAERARFDESYMATPLHRRRVAVVRRLVSAPRPAASPIGVRSETPGAAWSWRSALLPLAASVTLVSAVWWLQPWSHRPQDVVTHREPGVPPAVGEADPEPAVPPSPAPQLPTVTRPVVAVTLSPIAVRGAASEGVLPLSPGGDAVVRLDLAGHDPIAVSRLRAIVRTVAGEDVWEGPAVAANLPAGIVARVEVPAGRLRVDDYVVSLIASGPGGDQEERYRYFLRVRAR
jgi:hypothetical protein